MPKKGSNPKGAGAHKKNKKQKLVYDLQISCKSQNKCSTQKIVLEMRKLVQEANQLFQTADGWEKREAGGV